LIKNQNIRSINRIRQDIIAGWEQLLGHLKENEKGAFDYLIKVIIEHPELNEVEGLTMMWLWLEFDS
jgi:hypothetical protein